MTFKNTLILAGVVLLSIISVGAASDTTTRVGIAYLDAIGSSGAVQYVHGSVACDASMEICLTQDCSELLRDADSNDVHRRPRSAQRSECPAGECDLTVRCDKDGTGRVQFQFQQSGRRLGHKHNNVGSMRVGKVDSSDQSSVDVGADSTDSHRRLRRRMPQGKAGRVHDEQHVNYLEGVVDGVITSWGTVTEAGDFWINLKNGAEDIPDGTSVNIQLTTAGVEWYLLFTSKGDGVECTQQNPQSSHAWEIIQQDVSGRYAYRNLFDSTKFLCMDSTYNFYLCSDTDKNRQWLRSGSHATYAGRCFSSCSGTRPDAAEVCGTATLTTIKAI